MSEEPLKLDVPPWVWPLVVMAFVITAWAGLYIHLGGLVTAPVIGAALLALLAWRATTYRQPRARRVLPLFIVLVIVLVLQGLEQWLLGYADALAALFPLQFAGPVTASERMHLGVFTLASTTLYLVAAVGIFFHHPLGNYGAWLVATVAVVGGLALPLLQGAGAGFGYLPGMAMAVPAVALGLLLAARLVRAARSKEVTA
jgi:hypothetical protein